MAATDLTTLKEKSIEEVEEIAAKDVVVTGKKKIAVGDVVEFDGMQFEIKRMHSRGRMMIKFLRMI